MADAPALAADVVEQTVYALATVGYSLIPGFLEETACLELRAGLEDAVASYVPLGSERSHLDRYLLHDLLCCNLLFGRLLEDPRLQQLLSPLLGPYWTLYAFTSSSLPPLDSNYGRRIHIDSPRFVPGFPFNIGVLWALDDFTAENGGTEFLPGSHHSEKLPTEAFFDAHKHQVQCSRGSLLIFNARVAHRSGMNHTSEFRHALTMNVCRPFMKQRMDWVRFIPEEISSRLNAHARRVIGYDTRVPTTLEEFFVPEDQRLYKAGQS